MSDIAQGLASALSDRYRIERELGQGGMATVYLAEDVRHQRKVAVKVVHPELAAVLGAERFLSEIHVTATLQHPHILPLFDSGQADGQLFYVMPFVQGESLRGRLGRERQLPIEEAVRLSREVASALDYAHRSGVIHRDIKPENILLHDGRALVADFGIALAVTNAGGGRLTQTGLSLGTPQYMSPEQATGERDIDARTDVYSLGAVTYEMLTGEPPFTGPTAQAIVAKVITTDPPRPAAQRKSVPAHVEAAVLKSLEKMPADRFSTAAEFAAALENPAFTASSSRSATRPGRAGVPWRRASIALAAAVAVLLISTVWAVSALRSTTTPLLYDVGLADEAPLVFAGANLSVSPDGEFVVYAGGGGGAGAGDSGSTRLWYRSLLDGTTRPIDGSEGGSDPRISPDGKLLAFVAYPRLKIVPMTGGIPRAIADVRDPVGMEWVSSARLFLVDDDGGTLRWFSAQSGETDTDTLPYCVGPQWIAAVEELLCGGGGRKYALMMNPATGRYRVINTAPADRAAGLDIVAGSDFRIVDDDYVVFMSVEGDLVAARFDYRNARIGRPVRLVQNVRRESYRGSGQFTLAEDGTLVYASGPNAEIGLIVRASETTPPVPLPLAPAAFLRYRMSPDGRRLAAVVQATRSQELRIYDVRDGRSHAWLSHQVIGEPAWSPAGDRIATLLTTDRGEQKETQGYVVIGSPDATSAPDTVLRATDAFEPMSWPLDSLIIAQDWEGLLVLGVDPRTRPLRVDTLVRGANFPALAPGGRLLSYYSAATAELITTPFPARNRRVSVTRDGGEPHWLSPSRLSFRSGSTEWWRIDVDPTTGEVAGPAQRWLSDPRFSDTPGWSQHPTADGGLIYVQGPERTHATYLRVVPGWVARMKRAVDAAGGN